MFVTFMGGTGVDQADGGSIGVFDPKAMPSCRRSKPDAVKW